MRRGKHAPKAATSMAYVRSTSGGNLSRVKSPVRSVCQVVTTRDRICGQPGTMTGRSQMVTDPTTPKHELDLCAPHARIMRDSYGYHISYKENADILGRF